MCRVSCLQEKNGNNFILKYVEEEMSGQGKEAFSKSRIVLGGKDTDVEESSFSHCLVCLGTRHTNQQLPEFYVSF